VFQEEDWFICNLWDGTELLCKLADFACSAKETLLIFEHHPSFMKDPLFNDARGL